MKREVCLSLQQVLPVKAGPGTCLTPGHRPCIALIARPVALQTTIIAKDDDYDEEACSTGRLTLSTLLRHLA
ncbi:hypothetical protein M514_10475 [Trichuris suis]|uniref:Uncharacterized protein n=1 Tax=Trichuris suis TaxID=68888 RepID=A0A085MYH2_9BILA|nr:hypothetical protein M513_10475 [Trichuris suis]KFD62268.1 hypothetical protein M514_10475 [Trichuris suis]